LSNKSTKELDLVTVNELFKGKQKSVPNVKSFTSGDAHGPAKTIAVVNQKVALEKQRQPLVWAHHLLKWVVEFY